MWIYCRWLFFVSSGDAYAPFHRSEYFNLSCHCLSHSSRDCIGCRDHQIPQSQGGRNPRKTETRGRTGNRGLRRIAKQKATDDRWLFVASQTPPWAAPNKSTNFIHFLQKKNPLMTVHQRVCRFRTIFNPGHREDRAPKAAVPTKA